MALYWLKRSFIHYFLNHIQYKVKRQTLRILSKTLFVVYMLILVKLILFKGDLFYQVVSGSNQKPDSTVGTGYNLIPFRTISAFMTFHPSTSTSVKVFNVLGNIALFVPFGFLFPLVYRNLAKFKQVFWASVFVSLAFELVQLITRSGQFDVDDILLNSLGGVIGYFIFIAICQSFLGKFSEARR